MKPDFTQARKIHEVLDYLYMNSQRIFGILSNTSEQEVLHIIRLAGGYWRHNGDPKAPHAVMRSGKHSDGFISLPEALKFPVINDFFANLLVGKIKAQNPGPINWVVGSDHSAATFSYAVASRLSKEFPYNYVKHDFTEKAVVDDEEVQRWKRHVIGKQEVVLNLEELCTENTTLKRVRAGLAVFHAKFRYPIKYAPVIGMGVNRTGSNNFLGIKIGSLLQINLPEWDVKNGVECQRCKGGSEPLENVKQSAATWAKLNCR